MSSALPPHVRRADYATPEAARTRIVICPQTEFDEVVSFLPAPFRDILRNERQVATGRAEVHQFASVGKFNNGLEDRWNKLVDCACVLIARRWSK